MAHKILSVCYQECLSVSIIELLESAGYHMTCTRQVGAALQLLQSETFDLILINQTVSNPQEHLFVHLIREKLKVPVVFVSGDVHAKPEGVDVWLKPPVTGEALLQHISELLPDK